MKLKVHHLFIVFVLTIFLTILKLPIINEIISFIFYSLVPGFLIYNLIIRKSKYNSSIDLYLSLCLSLIFIMVGLLFINFAGNHIGIHKPLKRAFAG